MGKLIRSKRKLKKKIVIGFSFLYCTPSYVSKSQNPTSSISGVANFTAYSLQRSPMAVAPFSTIFFPSLPSIFTTSKSLKTPSSSSLILSQFSFETSHKKPPTPDPPESDGTGAAAPTRGDRFLERHHSVEAAKFVLKENNKDRKRKKDKALKVSLAVASCYGCGAPLQTLELDAPGYVEPETYELVRTWNYLCILCIHERGKPMCYVFSVFRPRS